MAYNPISGFTLQVITSTGQVASDYYLKLYEANTTTPLSMATDSSGTTLLTKAKIGDKGMPVSNPLDNSTVFIPHVNASYRLVIYTSESDADANNTAEAYVNVPFVSTLLGASGVGTAAYLDTGTAAGEVPTNSILASKGANYGKNLIINGDFSVNQRGVTGTVSLASGEYGHDRFKAGSGGCTYTFATSAAVTTITITAGTLLQIIEGQTIEAKPIILSWEGTAQGRINIGSYGDSGEVTATSIAGADITVEFDTGTLSKTQLEFGDTVTEFEYVSPDDQLARCKRYFEIFDSEINFCPAAPGYYESTTKVHAFINYTEKRKPPSISFTSPSTFRLVKPGTDVTPTAIITSGDTNNKTAMLIVTVPSATAGWGCILFSTTTGNISIDAEL